MQSALESDPLLTLKGRRQGISRERTRIKRQLAKIKKEITCPDESKAAFSEPKQNAA